MRKVVSAALAARQEGTNLTDEARTEPARIERMIAANWAAARRGDNDAIDRVMKLAERREKIARPRVNGHRMRAAVDATIEASRDINRRLDAAVIEGTQVFADQLDEVLANGSSLEVTKAPCLMPHRKNFLEAILATPQARRAAGIAAQDGGQGRRSHAQNVTNIARGGTG